MSADPLATLREYRGLAPWNLHDLATLTAALLEAAAVRPINPAAATTPNARTVRYYVTRGLVAAPDGRGTAAIYGYRHLLQVLAIKLRQMEGATLEAIAGELQQLTGDVLERRVAAALGQGLPAPDRLPFEGADSFTGGRTGRAFQTGTAADAHLDTDARVASLAWRRVQVGPGAELHLRADHPLADPERLEAVAEAVRLSLGRLVARGFAPES